MSFRASTSAPKVPLESAGGDEAECVRARLRERVSSPCGDDREVEPACHPPGVGGCAALLILSSCIVWSLGSRFASVKLVQRPKP
jgi:hypothetical protein